MPEARASRARRRAASSAAVRRRSPLIPANPKGPPTAATIRVRVQSIRRNQVARTSFQEPFEAQGFSGTALTKEECVAPPVLAILHARLTCDAPTALEEGRSLPEARAACGAPGWGPRGSLVIRGLVRLEIDDLMKSCAPNSARVAFRHSFRRLRIPGPYFG